MALVYTACIFSINSKVLGFKAIAKNNGSGVHGVHFFHHESPKTTHSKVLGFKAVAKNNGSGVHGVHFFSSRVAQYETSNVCTKSIFFIFLKSRPFLDVVFEVSVSQNYMFCQALESENDFSPF